MPRVRLAAVLAALAVAGPAAAQSPLPYSRIWLTYSTPAPWPEPNAVFDGSIAFLANGPGQVSFIGDVFVNGVGFPPDRRGIWAGYPTSLALIAREGAAVPGAGAGVGFDFFQIFPQAHGHGGGVAFKAALEGTGVDATNDRGVWVSSGGTLGMLARTGSAAPGMGAGVTFATVDLPAVNAADRAIFRGTVAGAGITAGQNDVGIWSGTVAGGSSLVVRAGVPAPGLPGLTLTNVENPLQTTGVYAFRGTLGGAGVTQDTDNALFYGNPGNWSVMVREGDAAPGFPAGSTFFNTAFDTRITRSGRVAFTSAAAGPGVNSFNNQGLWYGTPGNYGIVYREGDQAPGMPAGVTFRLGGSFEVTDAGQVALITPVSVPGGTDVAGQAYFAGTAGNLQLLAADSQQAPGLPDGVLFDFSQTSVPVISETGYVAFAGPLKGTGVTTSNDYAIWAGTPGNLRLVAREGDWLDVDPGPGQDLRQAWLVRITTQSFADDGRLLWTAHFTDGTSAAFFTPVPEPAGILAAAAGLIGLWRLRRLSSRRGCP
jgi:hypothetical protein